MIGRNARRPLAPRAIALVLGAALFSLCSGSCGDAVAAGTDTLAQGKRAYARQDYPLAARLLLPAAERGSATAQAFLGHMYEKGLGVPQNYGVAAAWLSQAAEQGEPTAQYLLALLYDKGFGVPQDWVQAEIWLILAAANAPHEKERDYWTRLRDAVAQKLTLDQIAEAQQRAYRWTPTSAPAARRPVIARY